MDNVFDSGLNSRDLSMGSLSDVSSQNLDKSISSFGLKNYEKDFFSKKIKLSKLQQIVNNFDEIIIDEVSETFLNSFLNALDSKMLANIKSLVIDDYLRLEYVERILAIMPNVKKFDWKVGFQESEVTTDIIKSNNLENFAIHDSYIDPQEICKLLARSPKLKNLTIDNCFRDSDFDLSNVDLSSLQSLKFRKMDLNHSNINQFLLNSPNLEFLAFDFCRIDDDLELKNLPNLLKLSQVEFEDFGENSYFIDNLLRQTPNLETIKLSNNIDEFDVKAFSDLSKIKNIHLDNIKLTTLGSHDFFAKLENVENIIINSCFHDQGLDFTGMSNSTAKNIEINKSIIAKDSLYKIMQLPNLEKLNINLINSAINHDFGDLPILENFKDLSIIRSNIDADILNEVLNKSPNLENISLDCCKGLLFLKLDDAIIFDNLHTIKLSGRSVKDYVIYDFLEKAPNLTKIDLEGCINLDQDLLQFSVAQLKDYFNDNFPSNSVRPYDMIEINRLLGIDNCGASR